MPTLSPTFDTEFRTNLIESHEFDGVQIERFDALIASYADVRRLPHRRKKLTREEEKAVGTSSYVAARSITIIVDGDIAERNRRFHRKDWIDRADAIYREYTGQKIR